MDGIFLQFLSDYFICLSKNVKIWRLWYIGIPFIPRHCKYVKIILEEFWEINGRNGLPILHLTVCIFKNNACNEAKMHKTIHFSGIKSACKLISQMKYLKHFSPNLTYFLFNWVPIALKVTYKLNLMNEFIVSEQDMFV